MIRDFNVDWLEHREFIPAQAFQTYVTGAGVAAGDPVFQEISTFGLTGGQVNAAGDSWATIWMPSDVDRSKQIRFRVWWTQTQGVTTDIMTWLVTYTQFAEDEALTDVAGGTGTGLNTVIGTDASSDDALALQATGFGILNRNTLDTDCAMVGLVVEADAIGTFSADEVSFLGLEIRYTPRRTAGPRKNILGGRRLLNAYPLGVQLHATQEGL